MERKLEDVAQTLRTGQRFKRKCSLLIGAGCSVSAGIPTAAGFVEVIKKDFPDAYIRADPKTYPRCMAELPPGFQRDLIAREVDSAKINWGHIAIAQLMASGYVDRVLTTNFDPLIVRACAMMGVIPAVYDFATSQLLKPDQVPDLAVFHLHGQRTGFVLMNTEEDCRDHGKRLGPLFDDAGRGRIWIVVGYSGENDPVFDHLATVENFDYGLYWVGYKDSEPAEHVRERLLTGDKSAYYVRGFDADRFLVELAQRLECFPPDFVARPFSYLENSLESLASFPLPDGDSEIDILAKPRNLIERAKQTFEAPVATAEGEAHTSIDAGDLAAASLLMAGKYADVEALGDAQGSALQREAIAWSRIAQGNTLLANAKTKSGAEADRLFAEAGEKYQAALVVKPDLHQALNNWGAALQAQAETKSGAEADRLFAEAVEKYRAALPIRPGYPEALNNWGNALQAQAETKSGAEADRLFAEAGDKYRTALANKPDYHEAIYNWGNALRVQANTKSGAEAERLRAEAVEKYQAALAIKPDLHEALNNWGAMLQAQAETKSGADADRLFAEAGDKYRAALAIKPDKHEALNNWGNALAAQARTKGGAEADRLFGEAGHKYQAALAIKPDKHEALNNWGAALAAQAETKSGEEADHLFAEAGDKYQAALAINPDYHDALNNWGNTLAAQAKTKRSEEADRLLAEAEAKYQAALAIKPDFHEALNNWGVALAARAQTKGGEEADRLLAEAEAKYQATLAIKPDKHEALNNWGAALAARARTKSGEDADRLFAEAGDKYQAALAIKPDYHDALYNWGNAVAAQAQTKSGEEADRLFAEAGDKYQAALTIKPDFHEGLNSWGGALVHHSAKKEGEERRRLVDLAVAKLTEGLRRGWTGVLYNLACATALQGDSEAAKRHLLAAKESQTLPDRAHVENDPDLASLRDEPWFKEFLQSLDGHEPHREGEAA